MKYLIATDLHGNVEAYKQLKRVADSERPDEIVLLGDLCDSYGYYPVNCVLDNIFYPILSVRGNCDRPDVMEKLNLGDKGVSFMEEVGEKRIYFTHGHVYGRTNLPGVLGKGDILFYGHYHAPEVVKNKYGVWLVCVGSAGRPRGGSHPTYCVFDGKSIIIRDIYTDETIFDVKTKEE